MSEEAEAKKVKVEMLDQHEVKCGACDKTLIMMLKISESEEKQKLLVNCPFCGGQSWLFEMSGKYFQAPAEGLGLANMEENDGVFILDLEVTND